MTDKYYKWINAFAKKLVDLGWNADVADSCGRISFENFSRDGEWPDPIAYAKYFDNDASLDEPGLHGSEQVSS